MSVGDISTVNNEGKGELIKYKIFDTEIVKFYVNAQSAGNTSGNDKDKMSFDNLRSKCIQTAEGTTDQKSFMGFMGVMDN
jgi:hypothetical protein